MSNRIRDSIAISRIAGRIRQILRLWGYSELLLPAIEPYAEELRDGARYADGRGFYLIKPDITSQIAVNIRDIGETNRLYYVSEVIRGGVTGKWQAGAELFGVDQKQGSLEILSVAISVLEALGIQDFSIDVGSTEAWSRITEGPDVNRKRVFEALSRRDPALLKSLGLNPEKENEILRMMNSRGRRTGIAELDGLVSDIGDSRVTADLGTVKLQKYYDGFIFEIYTPRTMKMLGSGGSYRIGNVTAVGFALDLSAFETIITTLKEPSRVSVSGLEAADAYSKARELVKIGIAVEVGKQ